MGERGTRRIRLRRGDAGFTLVELLVVMTIIGILAAIAVPVFVNQRHRAAETAVKSDLHRLAIVEQTALAGGGTYGTAAQLQAAGLSLRTSDSVVVSVLWANAAGYCLIATSPRSGKATPGSLGTTMGIPTRLYVQDTTSPATELTAANISSTCLSKPWSGNNGWFADDGYHSGTLDW